MLLQFLSLGNRIPACGQYNKSKKFSNDVPKPDFEESNCLIAYLFASDSKFTIIFEEYKEGLITVDRFFLVCTYA